MERTYSVGFSFTKESEDLFVVRINGLLTFEDMKNLESQISAEVDSNKKSKMLVFFEEFSGWSKEGDWGDLTFMYESDTYIERMAVVSSAKWKDWLLMFLGADSRKAQVKFFFENEAKDARDWLGEGSE